jgi:hypothetical protein
MNIIQRGILLLVVCMALINLASASYTLGNASSNIVSSYSSGENISGWINISLSNVPIDTPIRDGEGNVISLGYLLNKSNSIYECDIANCEDAFTSSSEATEKSFSLSSAGDKILGLKLTGNITEVSDLDFLINSNNAESCTNPLKINVANDNEVDWYYANSTGDYSCYNNYGCYTPNQADEEFRITNKEYCEKITVKEVPKLKIGAVLKKGTTPWGAGLLRMTIYDMTNAQKGYCDLDEPSGDGEANCEVNIGLFKEADYHVCIRALGVTETDYYIKAENTNPCGFFDVLEGNYTYDYGLFIKGARYSRIENGIFNKDNFYGTESLKDYLTSYVQERFDNRCDFGCIIPLKFISGVSQNVNVSSIAFDYIKAGGSVTSNKIYDVSIQAAKASSGYILLDLSKSGFKAPSNFGNSSLKIYIGDDKIIDKQIIVSQKARILDINPKLTYAAVPTKFRANVSLPTGISVTKYTWGFGNGLTRDTTNNSIDYTYNSTGLYQLSLTIQDSSGYTDTKTFDVNVGNPKDYLNTSIRAKRLSLDNVTTEINKLEIWKADAIKVKVNLTSLGNSINSIQQEYLAATSDDKYVELMTRLMQLRIPDSLTKADSNMALIILFNNIDPEKLKQLGAGTYKAGSYDELIKSWFISNMNGSISSEIFYLDYAGSKQPVMSFFKISLREKTDVEALYFVINNNVKFRSDSTRTIGSSLGFEVNNSNRDIEFYSEDGLTSQELQLYLSPKFSKLGGLSSNCNINGRCEEGENSDNCPEDCKSGNGYIWLIILILIVGFLAYIFLQEWYRMRYEASLFKAKSDLNNLIGYIRKSTKPENELVKELLNVGWNREQVVYALKKIKGKRTGMFEIPIPGFIRRFWDKQEEAEEVKETPRPFSFPVETRPEPVQQPERQQDFTNNQQNDQGFRSGFRPLKPGQ